MSDHDGTGQDTGRDTGGPEVGTLAEEAAKLADALGDWVRGHGHDLGEGIAGMAGSAADAARDVDDHLATGAAECRWCPVCRTVHLLRSTSPEVREHLVSAASSLVHAFAGMLDTPPPEPGRGERADRVEHIGLDEDWPEDEQDEDEDEDARGDR